MPFQIFVSYARNDDLPPLGEKTGFINDLYANLKQEFKRLGPETPELWRDKRQIEPSDQFDPIIEQGVKDSQVLLVVLSRNWLKRPYCLRELELFAARWKAEGDAAIRKRIVVVAKHLVNPNDRPPLLQGQEGFTFYVVDGEEKAGREQPLTDRDYYDVVGRLASSLWLRAQKGDAPQPPGNESSGGADAPKAGRTIYLAKPAADMRDGYLRLVDELRGRGYAVVPERDDDIPHDPSAPEFIDAALATAECSIHLLGDKAGYEPAEDVERIVKLQLQRAANRAAALPSFRRIIWAPKVLVDQDGAGASAGERDPFEVLKNFDPALDSDKIDGSELSKFTEFVVQRLADMAPRAALVDLIEGDAQVYVYHRQEDTEYAVDFAKALQQRNVTPVFPTFEGDPVELTAWHKQRLRESDAVVVCWANAAEVWALSQFSEFKNWQELGREKKFACRALVAGPPPGQRKLVLIEVPPRKDVDLVLDLTKHEKPTPEDLDPLINAAR
jgi:hypothetical protein